MKKVISFSLWGNNPKYTIGAIKNAELALKIYPDWTCRYYVGKNTPIDIIQKLMYFNNTEIKIMNDSGNWSGMFWRFYAAVDPDVDVMISRDTDSRLSQRERTAVDDWIDSNKGFHIMRDHPYHQTQILGGMFGIKKNTINNLYELLNSYNKADFWQVDQNFLKEKIYPLIYNNSKVHDPFFENKPFPTNRTNHEFVGEVYDENDCRNQEHYLIIKNFTKDE
jgi:hypothetical protein